MKARPPDCVLPWLVQLSCVLVHWLACPRVWLCAWLFCVFARVCVCVCVCVCVRMALFVCG